MRKLEAAGAIASKEIFGFPEKQERRRRLLRYEWPCSLNLQGWRTGPVRRLRHQSLGRSGGSRPIRVRRFGIGVADHFAGNRY